MSRFDRLVARFTKASRVTSTTLFLDIGSSVTKIIEGQRPVVMHPTCVAVHVPSQAVVEIGTKALALMGKTPPQVEVFFPVQNGQIAYPQYANVYLQTVLERMNLNQSWSWQLTTHLKIAVNNSLSQLHQEGWRQTAIKAGFTNVNLVPTAQALVARLERHKHEQTGLCVIDIGADKTEMMCFLGATLIVSKTIQLGGQHFTAHVIDKVRTEYSCEIGWATAEKIKMQIGKVIATEGNSVKVPDQKMVIRGKDVVKNVPMTLPISAEVFYPGFTQLATEISDQLKQTLASVPAEVLANALENGIFLTGGGSVLQGLAAFVTHYVQSQAIMSPTPSDDVVRGLLHHT